MKTFEDLVRDKTVPNGHKTNLTPSEPFVQSEEHTPGSEVLKQKLDDFGIPAVAKASSPFETKLSAKKVLNPNQKSLQALLKEQQRQKTINKAASLYNAFKKHCAQNKIDPAFFIGAKK